MNIKTIIFGCVAVGIAATGGLMIKLQKTNNEAIYTPRGAGEELTKGFAGYAEYIHSLRANQITGEIDMDAYNKAKTEVFALAKMNSNKALNMTWDQKGPDNVGGRTRAILVDKNNPNLVYAGSIAGGLFVSTNGGGTWTPIAEMADNLAISCITQTSTGRIFFGTGCSFESINGTSKGTPGFTGNGVYEYVPSTQTVLPVLVNTGTVPNNNGSETALNIVNAIAAKGERLYIGTADGMLYADPTSGTYPTTTAGWVNPIYLVFPTIKQNATVNDIDIASNGSVVVCFRDKVYHSFSDADNSFTKTDFSGADRISAAIAPSDPNYIYLLIAKSIGGNEGDQLEGVYLSTSFDGSNFPQFEKVIPGGAKSIDPFLQNGGTGSGQGVYDQAIAVDPSNKNRCIIGGVQLYELNIIPNSSPIGGNWVKTAHLIEGLGAPYYMHADKHTIFWKDANTVYIGTDGGVFKSTNGGTNWSEKNLGYNVTTFFSVAYNELGWALGGSQDNGCQLVGFGDLGTPGPLNAIEVTGGDGFTVEFSSLAGGIAYTTSQYGKLYRTLLSGGGAATFYDGELSNLANCSNNSCSSFNTTIQYWESTNDLLTSDSIEITFNGTDTLYPGQWYPYTSLSNGTTLYYTPPTTIPVDTSTTLMWPDYIQHKMAFGGIPGSIYLTRQASNLGAPMIDWVKIAGSTATPDAFSGNAQIMQFSPDGNTLFVGASGGSLYRIDNLSAGGGYSVIDTAYIENDSIKLDIRSSSHVTTCTRIETWPGRSITGIAVDPNNGNNLVVTLGNYGNTNYVYRSTDALGTGTFTSIQGPASPGAGYLPRMPVYDAEIDFIDNDRVIIGTEWGIFASENAFGPAGAVQWNEENNGLAHVPVFEVRQVSKYNLTDSDGNYLSGRYYLGTHGKGFYTSSTFTTGINPNEDLISKDEKFVSNLNVYPNPLNNVGNVSFILKDNAKTVANIYSLTGKLVKTVDFGLLPKGEHNERFDASTLSIGTYILSVESGKTRSVAKFIVTR